MKIDTTRKYKIVQAYRELAILEFVTQASRSEGLPPLFTEYIEVLCTEKEVLGEDIKNLFVVMKPSKLSLRSLISGIHLKDKDFKRMLYNILLGLHFLHASNIVHRDIKPENLLINDHGELQICDFGMARTLPQCC